MSWYRLVPSWYPFALSASFALAAGIYINKFIFKEDFLFESSLGWTLAFSNKIMEMAIKNIVSSQGPKEFIGSFIFWNSTRLALLVGILFMIFVNSRIHGPAFIFAFLIAYFVLFVYYIFAVKNNNPGK